MSKWIFFFAAVEAVLTLSLPAQDDGIDRWDEKPASAISSASASSSSSAAAVSSAASQSNTAVSSFEAEYKAVKETFLYGTYAQQLDALSRFKNLDASRAGWVDLLKIPAESADDPVVLTRLMDIVYDKKLSQYYPVFTRCVSEKNLLREGRERGDLSFVTAALRYMMRLSNQSDAKHFEKIWKEREEYTAFPDVLAMAVQGLGAFKTAGTADVLKLWYYETEIETLREAVIKAVCEWQREQDVAFYDQIISDDGERPYLKWIAVICLMKYPSSEAAWQILSRLSSIADAEIKSRAIYAMAFFQKPEVIPLLMRSAKDNSPRIRYFAVSGLKQFKTEEVNTLLMYKYQYDSEPQIKAVAREILNERGLLPKDAK